MYVFNSPIQKSLKLSETIRAKTAEIQYVANTILNLTEKRDFSLADAKAAELKQLVYDYLYELNVIFETDVTEPPKATVAEVKK